VQTFAKTTYLDFLVKQFTMFGKKIWQGFDGTLQQILG
jgi:hypothetical protein